MISKINVPSLEPLMFKRIIAGNGVSKFLLRGSLEYQNERLKRIIERDDQKSINNEFRGIVHSLYQLMSKKPINPSDLNFETSIEDWKKQMTKAVKQIANDLQEFVRTLVIEYRHIPIIREKEKDLREFAGLNDVTNLL
jgi:hypothetical protein